MRKILAYFLPVAVLLLTACNNDDDTTNADSDGFGTGVFVINEGNYLSGNGSLSFINTTTDEVTNYVYAAQNGGADLGDVFQSAYATDDLMYLVVNNSNKVEVVDTDSLFSQFTITDVAYPRYMTSSGDKGYLTEWVSYIDPGAVVVFDLESGEISNTISTGDYGAEGIIVSGDKLFVTNNWSTTVTVIDIDSEEVDTTFEVGNSPDLMVLDADGDVWVACAGGYDSNYNYLNDGKLVEINPDTYAVKSEIELGYNISGKIASNARGTLFYYIYGTSVYQVDPSTQDVTELLTESGATYFYGIGVDDDGTIYVGDAKDFNQDGEVFVYTSSGTLQSSYDVSVGPNGFLFR